MEVPFNIPHITGQESKYLADVIETKKLSGNGKYTKQCQDWFKERFGIKHCLLTTSCTDALEMSSILADIKPGDEVIIPTYTFVSAANAFVLRGAKIVFTDSQKDHPNIDHTQIESLITARTKAIVVVHYAGVACDMDAIMDIANKHGLIVIEDAAQSIGVKYKDRFLGTIGHFGTYSFHATKNIQCGEGGLLIVNDDKYVERSEIIWEKGTNRAAFFRGEVDKYTWVDVGSSFLPSELNAAFLWAQLENYDQIQHSRLAAWKYYEDHLAGAENIALPNIPDFSTNNAHIFYILCNDEEHRNDLSAYLKERSIQAYFHFGCLDTSKVNQNIDAESNFPNAQKFEQKLLRLPLFNDISKEQLIEVIMEVKSF